MTEQIQTAEPAEPAITVSGGGGGAGSAYVTPEPAESAESTRTPEDLQAEIAKLRKEAAGWRTKLREVEPLAAKYAEAQEAQKTEVQRATEQAQKLAEDLAARDNELIVLRVAAKYGIPEEDHDFLGSGTQEEVDARGARYAARFAAVTTPTAPPPSDRPVESLRPGASPTPPPAVDNSYPAAWLPRESN